jgi:hypothetical protein
LSFSIPHPVPIHSQYAKRTRRAVEVKKLKAKGLGLRAIARELKMPPPSSVHKALQLTA